ncbi:transglutaminaseTgpA domain-containing protein [Neobacillus sp.]|uniref:transglutaminase TgpA family protein n=1 Tax=Neobacillus sp. TaxID=2675273 RepID=UPI00289909C1|nr:transglutaminaseTgpA domain-containing protein [Neobacillus sp.]
MMKRDFPALLLYSFGFLLLWEWLRPVEQLTDTDSMEMFVFFLLISFALSFFRMKWMWQSIIKLLFILFSINRFYYEEGFFQSSWLKSFSKDLMDNIGFLQARQWNDLSNEFRTLLFFILLWLMVYLIHYWLLNRQKIFIFFFMTLVYITVLDTFTLYSAKAAIVRTVITGFAVMGLLTYYRITQKEKVNDDRSILRKWMVPLVGMIALSVLIGIAAPKAAPIWPDPVPYFTAAKDKGGNEGSGGISRIGYGTNDERLGGPFIGDNKPVFMYKANGKNYWKVETKDMYTGKGWIPSGSTPIPFMEGDLAPVYSIPEKVETIKETAQVFFYTNYSSLSFIIYPAGIQKILEVEPKAPKLNKFEIDTTKEKINSFSRDISSYKVDFGIPKYKAVDLMLTTEFDSTVMGPEFYQKYTYLPEGLPLRIKQLTEEITVGKSNWFDKAQAVEGYFSNSGYSYDQKKVALPGDKDDYVDQFLFDTKRGYCDNFSTSMAVMLRTIGIPTRWVKGFTGGDFMEYSKGGESRQIYQITNNNAHSWVEVFFPNQGWVPFEPTKGFTNGININYSSGQTSSNNQTPPPAPVKKPQQKDLEETSKTKSKEKSLDFKELWSNTKLFFWNNWKLMTLVIVLLAGMTGILYRIRGKWLPFVVMVWYRFKKKDETVGTAYLVLLAQLDRYGIKRKQNQTLRNYAHYIDSFFSTREMTRLTVAYEQYIYHQNLPKGTWKESRELWENLIKKTIA